MVFVLLGTLNAWTANYFASDAYSEHPDDLSWKIKGSAACFSRTNVCTSPSCLSTAVRNDCPFDGRQAALDLASSLILFAFLGAFAVVERRMATVLDLAAQTAEDYSVAVLDPGPGDTDPEEWRTFFSQWGHVTYVTVAVGNGTLLNALAKRRRLTKLIGMERRGSSVAFGPGFAKDIGVNVAWGARTAAKHVSDAFNGRAEDSTPQAPSADTIDRSGGCVPRRVLSRSELFSHASPPYQQVHARPDHRRATARCARQASRQRQGVFVLLREGRSQGRQRRHPGGGHARHVGGRFAVAFKHPVPAAAAAGGPPAAVVLGGLQQRLHGHVPGDRQRARQEPQAVHRGVLGADLQDPRDVHVAPLLYAQLLGARARAVRERLGAFAAAVLAAVAVAALRPAPPPHPCTSGRYGPKGRPRWCGSSSRSSTRPASGRASRR